MELRALVGSDILCFQLLFYYHFATQNKLQVE